MNHITLTQQDYKILLKLQNEIPKRIIVDNGYGIVFHYGTWHISVVPESFAVVSQNRYDEAIGVRCAEKLNYYAMRQDERILFKANPVEKIWIVRTFLYFSDHVTFEDPANKLSLPLQGSKTKSQKRLNNFLSQVTGTHEEIICHPLSDEANEADDEFSNLVDAGFIFQIDGKLIRCFSPENAFYLSGTILTQTELEDEILPFYELIEFDSNFISK